MSPALGLRSPGGAPLVNETSRDLPLVTVTVALRNGALTDPLGKEGLARIAARLMRRTGGGLSAKEIDERIDALGASLGVEVSHSAFSISGTVIRRNFPAFLELLRQVLAEPSLEADELERLKRETAAELIESRDNDRSLARRWFRARLFDGHPYARATSGTLGSLDTLTEQEVRAFHGRALVRGNLIFAFSGDIDEREAIEAAGRLEASLPEGPPQTDGIGDPVVPPGRRLVFVDKPDRSQTQILIGGLGSHPADPDHTALLLGNTVFGGTFTARMTREIRSKRGWSYGAYSSLPYDRHRRSFSMWTFPQASDAAPCVELELQLLEAWHTHGVTRAEATWAKRYLVRSNAFSIDTAAKRAARSLEEIVYDLPEGYHAGYLDRLKALTAEDTNAAIHQRISPRDVLVVVVGTEADVGAELRDAIGDLASSETVAFDSDV